LIEGDGINSRWYAGRYCTIALLIEGDGITSRWYAGRYCTDEYTIVILTEVPLL
jgi:hypothetical protein